MSFCLGGMKEAICDSVLIVGSSVEDKLVSTGSRVQKEGACPEVLMFVCVSYHFIYEQMLQL